MNLQTLRERIERDPCKPGENLSEEQIRKAQSIARQYCSFVEECRQRAKSAVYEDDILEACAIAGVDANCLSLEDAVREVELWAKRELVKAKIRERSTRELDRHEPQTDGREQRLTCSDKMKLHYMKQPESLGWS